MTSVATDVFEEVIQGLDSKPPCFRIMPEEHSAVWIGVGHHLDGTRCVVGFSCQEHKAVIEERVRIIRDLSMKGPRVFPCTTHGSLIDGVNYEIAWEPA